MFPVEFEQTLVLPVIASGIEGAEFTTIEIVLAVAFVGEAQFALEVRIHVTTCPLVKPEVENSVEFVPTFVPFNFH